MSQERDDAIKGIVNTIKGKGSGNESSGGKGTQADLQAMSPEQLQQFAGALQSAMQGGQQEFEFGGKIYPVSESLLQAVKQLMTGGRSADTRGMDSGQKGGSEGRPAERSGSPSPPGRPAPPRRP